MNNYRLSSLSVDTSGARLMQEVYLDADNRVTLEQDGNSVYRAKKWLSWDNLSLLFERLGLPASYQVYQTIGQEINLQTWDGTSWTTQTASYPLYHSPSNSNRKQAAFSPSGDAHYHWAVYGSSSYLMKTTDNGETYTQSTALGDYAPIGTIVPKAGWIVAYHDGSVSWQGVKISEDDGATWTSYVTGMRFTKIIKWGDDLIGYYGNRIFRSTDDGVTWDGTAYATAGYELLGPSGSSSFWLRDIFVYDDELYAVTSYADENYYYWMRSVKFSTPMTADAEGTQVALYHNPYYLEGEWDTHPNIHSLIVGSNGAISTIIDPWYNEPFAVDWVNNGVQFILWDYSTEVPPDNMRTAWYDKLQNRYVVFYQDLDVVWNEEIEDYEVVAVADRTVYWTTDTPTFSYSDYRTGFYNNIYNAINDK